MAYVTSFMNDPSMPQEITLNLQLYIENMNALFVTLYATLHCHVNQYVYSLLPNRKGRKQWVNYKLFSVHGWGQKKLFWSFKFDKT